MTLTDILTTLEAALHQPVQDAGGELHVSGTVEDTLEKLVVAPTGWRLILQLNGDEAPADGYGSLIQPELLAVVQVAKGLAIQAGADIHRPRVGSPGFLGRLEWVRDRLRGVRWVHDPAPGEPESVASLHYHQGLIYRGWQWLEVEGVPTRQASLRFLFHLGLPAPVDVPVRLPADPDL